MCSVHRWRRGDDCEINLWIRGYFVDAATRIFIAQGYRRTQMADVAAAMSIGKGTLYGYVESKAALFQFALEHCDDNKPIEAPALLPIPTPPRTRAVPCRVPTTMRTTASATCSCATISWPLTKSGS